MRIYGLLNVRLEHGNRPVMTALRDLAAPACPSLVKKALPKMRGRRECRARRAHPQPRVRKIKAHELVHHRFAERAGIPCAMVLTGSFVVSPVNRAFLPPSPCNAKHCHELIPASGYQDATTSPSAKRALVSRALRVHRIPHPTSVTIAIRPSYRARDARKNAFDLPDDTSERPAAL